MDNFLIILFISPGEVLAGKFGGNLSDSVNTMNTVNNSSASESVFSLSETAKELFGRRRGGHGFL